ncbi:hypothetical protein NDU88_006569 [Pleurodeles waltl]|uniref:Uncharacterized protein n=1 Tax=Pleurodeles waltl TaxID=8319 RepID=A0AAV7MD88_PLEWA|nr:hypothetical protein NDU88_006569 [Pleurodeles waltl]
MTGDCENEDGGLTGRAADPVLRACGRTSTSVFAASLLGVKDRGASEAHRCVRDLPSRRWMAAPPLLRATEEGAHYYQDHGDTAVGALQLWGGRCTCRGAARSTQFSYGRAARLSPFLLCRQCMPVPREGLLNPWACVKEQNGLLPRNIVNHEAGSKIN